MTILQKLEFGVFVVAVAKKEPEKLWVRLIPRYPGILGFRE